MEVKKLDIEVKINKKVGQLAIKQNQIASIESERDLKIRDIKKKAAKEIEKQKVTIESIGKEIYKLFKANFSLLTDGGKNKVIILALGKVGIRLNRPSVWTKNKDKTIYVLRSLGLSRFIKIKPEETLDKIAMANEPDMFRDRKEISITQKEVFFVKPDSGKEYQRETKKNRLN